MADSFYVLLASFLFHLSVCSCLQLWIFKKQLFHASQVVQVVKKKKKKKKTHQPMQKK